MAQSIEYLQNQRWTEFRYFVDGGADGWEAFSISQDKAFRITEVRLHFSVAFASTEDLTARVSATKGSAFNYNFLSYPISAVSDVIIMYESNGLKFQSDDQVVFGMSMASGTNIYGLEVLGWAAYG